jgi:hypothetical protein
VGREGDGPISGGAIFGFYGAIKLCIRDGYDPSGVFQVVLDAFHKGDLNVSIDARVKTVFLLESTGGYLELIDRPGKGEESDGIAGQRRLHFDVAPEEVTALNGLDIWGSANNIMLGDVEIAKRNGYTEIIFVDRDTFLDAVKKYHASHSQNGESNE